MFPNFFHHPLHGLVIFWDKWKKWLYHLKFHNSLLRDRNKTRCRGQTKCYLSLSLWYRWFSQLSIKRNPLDFLKASVLRRYPFYRVWTHWISHMFWQDLKHQLSVQTSYPLYRGMKLGIVYYTSKTRNENNNNIWCTSSFTSLSSRSVSLLLAYSSSSDFNDGSIPFHALSIGCFDNSLLERNIGHIMAT